MKYELRTKNYRLNTSDERQATNDEFALFWSFYVSFCAFCASLWLKRTVFTRLLKKAIVMALWTKATLCVKSSLLEQILPGTPSRPKTCLPHEIAQRYLFGVISASKNLCNLLLKICAICGKNLRNPWLINDLRSTKDYVRKNKLFMQNKANFRKSQMNVNKVLIKDYDKMDTWSIRKTKPIQSQLKPIQSQSKPILTQNKPNSNPNKPN